MKLPDKVYVWVEDPGERGVCFYDEPHPCHSVEYIRADMVPQWQPIETAPKDGTRFLAYEATRSECRYYECWYQQDFPNWSGWQDDWDSEPAPPTGSPSTHPRRPTDARAHPI